MPTSIYFGATSEGKISIRVDEDFVAVSQALRDGGWAGLTVKGKDVFVNAQNVLWLEDSPSKTGRAASF
jgi:hypothetical protein